MSFLQILGINGAIGTIVVLITGKIAVSKAEKKYGTDAVEAQTDDVQNSVCSPAGLLLVMLNAALLVFAWEIFLPARLVLYEWMVSQHSDKRDP